MNGISKNSGDDEHRPDLLSHKYRPTSAERFRCHSEQGLRLKRWIQYFIGSPNSSTKGSNESDDDYSSAGSDISDAVQIIKNCALLTGPPGVGKTSLVYTVANELNLHVIESHSSERRDARLFSMLKLTNQIGKINAFAKLFQAAAKQQKIDKKQRKRKRRKLSESSEQNQPRQLSLSGDISIVLFDDIDVVFEEDGPFLKSLVEFIKESKRPVVLTATRSVDQIKAALLNCEHINLERPTVEDCSSLLRDVCRREKYLNISKKPSCQSLASHYDCDIRQCLNLIHFYGNQANECLYKLVSDSISLNLERMNSDDIIHETDRRSTITNCYLTSSLVDFIESRLNLVNKSTLLQRWIDGVPSFTNEDDRFGHELGEQIKETVVDLTRKLYSTELHDIFEMEKNRRESQNKRDTIMDMAQIMNERIKSRVEPPEKEFFTDIIPYLGETVRMEGEKRATFQPNGGSSRRSKRFTSYLDSVAIYMEPSEFRLISQTMLHPQLSLTDIE